MSEESERAVILFLTVVTLVAYAAVPLFIFWPPMEDVADRIHEGCEEGRWDCEPRELTPAMWLLWGGGFLVSIVLGAAHVQNWRSRS